MSLSVHRKAPQNTSALGRCSSPLIAPGMSAFCLDDERNAVKIFNNYRDINKIINIYVSDNYKHCD